MTEYIRLLAFGAATFCVGVALAVGLIFSLASRHSDPDSGEGFLGKFLTMFILSIAFCFFYIAVVGF